MIGHPSAKGDAAELQWRRMLEDYLPERYCVAKGFVLDCDGKLSQQIDVIVYDRQYSPLLFNQDETRYVPAESVYALLEVKQELNPGNILYAGDKIASVRRLRRTSAEIPHAGGVYKPKKPIPILGGILTLDSSWHSDWQKSLHEILKSLASEQRLDIGCALKIGSFEAIYKGNRVSILSGSNDSALIFFFLKLLARLQASGTVAALDFNEYGRVL